MQWFLFVWAIYRLFATLSWPYDVACIQVGKNVGRVDTKQGWNGSHMQKPQS